MQFRCLEEAFTRCKTNLLSCWHPYQWPDPLAEAFPLGCVVHVASFECVLASSLQPRSSSWTSQ